MLCQLHYLAAAYSEQRVSLDDVCDVISTLLISLLRDCAVKFRLTYYSQNSLLTDTRNL